MSVPSIFTSPASSFRGDGDGGGVVGNSQPGTKDAYTSSPFIQRLFSTSPPTEDARDPAGPSFVSGDRVRESSNLDDDLAPTSVRSRYLSLSGDDGGGRVDTTRSVELPKLALLDEYAASGASAFSRRTFSDALLSGGSPSSASANTVVLSTTKGKSIKKTESANVYSRLSHTGGVPTAKLGSPGSQNQPKSWIAYLEQLQRADEASPRPVRPLFHDDDSPTGSLIGRPQLSPNSRSLLQSAVPTGMHRHPRARSGDFRPKSKGSRGGGKNDADDDVHNDHDDDDDDDDDDGDGGVANRRTRLRSRRRQRTTRSRSGKKKKKQYRPTSSRAGGVETNDDRHDDGDDDGDVHNDDDGGDFDESVGLSSRSSSSEQLRTSSRINSSSASSSLHSSYLTASDTVLLTTQSPRKRAHNVVGQYVVSAGKSWDGDEEDDDDSSSESSEDGFQAAASKPHPSAPRVPPPPSTLPDSSPRNRSGSVGTSSSASSSTTKKTGASMPPPSGSAAASVRKGGGGAAAAASVGASSDDGEDMTYQKIYLKDLEFAPKPVAHGAYGVVYKGRWRNVPVAVKELHVPLMDPLNIALFKREASLLSKVSRHPNIVNFLGVVHADRKMFMVTEWESLGSLSAVLKQRRSITLKDIVRIASGIANGMNHLHCEGVIHRDLAARNVLVGDGFVAKITDFGMSRLKSGSLHSNEVTRGHLGPVKWLSPEAIRNKEYSEFSDVWMFGVTLWEIVTRKEPWAEEDLLMVAVGVGKEGWRLKVPKGTDPVLSKVMKACWRRVPTSRPGFQKLLSLLQNYYELLCLGRDVLPNMSALQKGKKAKRVRKKKKKKNRERRKSESKLSGSTLTSASSSVAAGGNGASAATDGASTEHSPRGDGAGPSPSSGGAGGGAGTALTAHHHQGGGGGGGGGAQPSSALAKSAEDTHANGGGGGGGGASVVDEERTRTRGGSGKDKKLRKRRHSPPALQKKLTPMISRTTGKASKSSSRKRIDSTNDQEGSLRDSSGLVKSAKSVANAKVRKRRTGRGRKGSLNSSASPRTSVSPTSPGKSSSSGSAIRDGPLDGVQERRIMRKGRDRTSGSLIETSERSQYVRDQSHHGDTTFTSSSSSEVVPTTRNSAMRVRPHERIASVGGTTKRSSGAFHSAREREESVRASFRKGETQSGRARTPSASSTDKKAHSQSAFRTLKGSSVIEEDVSNVQEMEKTLMFRHIKLFQQRFNSSHDIRKDLIFHAELKEAGFAFEQSGGFGPDMDDVQFSTSTQFAIWLQELRESAVDRVELNVESMNVENDGLYYTMECTATVEFSKHSPYHSGETLEFSQLWECRMSSTLKSRISRLPLLTYLRVFVEEKDDEDA